jgi:hypothetical protein
MVVVGNCQARALEIVMSTNEVIRRDYEFASFPAVHEIPEEMVGALHDAVAAADVLVAQRIDEGYRNGLGLGTETLARMADTALVVRWPSVHWAGYFPDLFYLRDAAGQPVVDGPFDYHDRTILEAYAAGADVPATCRLLQDPDRPSGAPAWAERATAELALRGQDCDVDVAPVIASQFRERLLFFTMNHPANHMLSFIAERVLQLIGVTGGISRRNLPHEVLGSTFYPLHVNHALALGLEFADQQCAGRTPFRIRGESYEPSEAVRMFFDYYSQHPELVGLNLATGE